MIYISSTVKHGSLNLFADDTLLTVCADYVDNAIDKVNEELERIYMWLNSIKFKLNVNKTKYMIISNALKSVIINNETIERVDMYYKIFGNKNIVDQRLTFSDHVLKIVKTVSSKTNLLSRESDIRKLQYYKTVQCE